MSSGHKKQQAERDKGVLVSVNISVPGDPSCVLRGCALVKSFAMPLRVRTYLAACVCALKLPFFANVTMRSHSRDTCFALCSGVLMRSCSMSDVSIFFIIASLWE